MLRDGSIHALDEIPPFSDGRFPLSCYQSTLIGVREGMRYLELAIENMEDYAAQGRFGSWRVLILARTLRSARAKNERDDLCHLLAAAEKELHAMKAVAPNSDADSLADLASQLQKAATEMGSTSQPPEQEPPVGSGTPE